MAKYEGIFEINGTIQGMTFFKSKDGLLIRKKGGVSKNRIANDPAFQRTRENGSEFSENAKMGQLMRKSVTNLIILAKDHRVSSRMLKAMSVVKNYDFISDRGKRTVANGIKTAAAKQTLVGFEFNVNSRFDSVFKGNYVLDAATGAVAITDFNPATNLGIPQGATHATLSVAVSAVDFGLLKYETVASNKENFALTPGLIDLALLPPSFPTGGVDEVYFYYFLIEFFQELNGKQYPLKNNTHNVLYLMAVE